MKVSQSIEDSTNWFLYKVNKKIDEKYEIYKMYNKIIAYLLNCNMAFKMVLV